MSASSSSSAKGSKDASDDGLPELELPRPVDRAGELTLLRDGELEVEGRMPYSSNATFLVVITHSGCASRAIYKPGRGERPLWDFARSLYRREAAAYELAAWLGWDVIPPTIVRDGEFGEGSVQLFVDADFSQHYFTLREHRDDLEDQLVMLCALDVLANNADRKSGHVLVDGADRIWGIDQGLCFHVDMKLRTVMWDYASERVPIHLRADVHRLAEADPAELGALCGLLDDEEIAALQSRAARLAKKGAFPLPHSDHAYPWPLV